jgi:hypothetical protein
MCFPPPRDAVSKSWMRKNLLAIFRGNAKFAQGKEKYHQFYKAILRDSGLPWAVLRFGVFAFLPGEARGIGLRKGLPDPSLRRF